MAENKTDTESPIGPMIAGVISDVKNSIEKTNALKEVKEMLTQNIQDKNVANVRDEIIKLMCAYIKQNKLYSKQKLLDILTATFIKNKERLVRKFTSKQIDDDVLPSPSAPPAAPEFKQEDVLPKAEASIVPVPLANASIESTEKDVLPKAEASIEPVPLAKSSIETDEEKASIVPEQLTEVEEKVEGQIGGTLSDKTNAEFDEILNKLLIKLKEIYKINDPAYDDELNEMIISLYKDVVEDMTIADLENCLAPLSDECYSRVDKLTTNKDIKLIKVCTDTIHILIGILSVENEQSQQTETVILNKITSLMEMMLENSSNSDNLKENYRIINEELLNKLTPVQLDEMKTKIKTKYDEIDTLINKTNMVQQGGKHIKKTRNQQKRRVTSNKKTKKKRQ